MKSSYFSLQPPPTKIREKQSRSTFPIHSEHRVPGNYFSHVAPLSACTCTWSPYTHTVCYAHEIKNYGLTPGVLTLSSCTLQVSKMKNAEREQTCLGGQQLEQNHSLALLFLINYTPPAMWVLTVSEIPVRVTSVLTKKTNSHTCHTTTSSTALTYMYTTFSLEYFHNMTLYSKVCRWSGFIQLLEVQTLPSLFIEVDAHVC